MTAMDISTTLSTTAVDDSRLAEILANPGFGTYFTDHMFTVEWTPEKGWYGARITPYGPLTLDPATAVLHYAQETFEGMKAYRHADGSVWTFRPEENAARIAGFPLLGELLQGIFWRVTGRAECANLVSVLGLFGLVGFFGMNYLLFWFCQNTVGVQFPFAYMFFAFALSRRLTASRGD